MIRHFTQSIKSRGADLAVIALLAVTLMACRAPAPVVTQPGAPAQTPETPPIEAAFSPMQEFLQATIANVEPTALPGGGDVVSVQDLPVGQPGHYVNVTFGYRLQYPQDWHTRFGSRPLLVSFSNLDPGQHNRLSMRGSGCLIEINAGINIYSLSLQDLMAQMPKGFANAETIDLGGQEAIRVMQNSPENPFDSEWIYVQHDGRLIGISFEYARETADLCRPVWENMLATWQWFEPDFTVYRNTMTGYAISYPVRWFRFNGRDEGATMSSVDPANAAQVADLAAQGMVVYTTVLDNPQDLSLREWIVQNEDNLGFSNDINLDGLLGVRSVRSLSDPNLQQMSGYFQGPLGRIYVVRCVYPQARQWEFRPIANAIIYSFSF